MVTNDYIVDIANRDGQLQLNVTDRKTGQTSTIQVSGLQNNSNRFLSPSFIRKIIMQRLFLLVAVMLLERMLNRPA